MAPLQGLTTQEADTIRTQEGANILPEKKRGLFKKLYKWIISPVSLMLVAAALLSLMRGSVPDFWIISTLFLSNFLISVWHERKADTSIEKLRKHLSLQVRTLRDGVWQHVDSSLLVRGDVVEIRVGTVVPADITIADSSNLSIDESVLTGESLPKEKHTDDIAYSGSFVATGKATGTVVATGAHTSFGKTVTLIDETPRKSALEKDILSISKSISLLSIGIVIILTTVFLFEGTSISSILALDLSLLIAGIPVALPTVMSLIISIGVVDLARKSIIVRRLASLEDLANVDMLLSDKTGTLTENKIHVEKVISFGSYTEEDVVKLAVSAIPSTEGDPLDTAVSTYAREHGVTPYTQTEIIPGDSERKRSTGLIVVDGTPQVVSIGAAQVIASLCTLTDDAHIRLTATVQDAAKQGYRVHVLAVNPLGTEEKGMQLVGILYLADRLHADAHETIQFMNEQGIGVTMLTGDNYEISSRIANEVGLKGTVYRRDILDTNPEQVKKDMGTIACFAEVLPKDKYTLVGIARQSHVVAVTGDGINDLPAVKAADVGFAVSNAVDALKSTADIVLLSSGISVIKDAIVEARKIFIRHYNYSLYRISESFRIIITIAVLGLIYKTYPLTAVQLIILAFLNDVPIVSLAFDRVKAAARPAHINIRERLRMGSLYGLTGIANSLSLFYVMIAVLHLPWDVIQTAFFLKLTVSGHMLVYVAHTRERWFRFLPSWQVITATSLTQILATLLALFGIFTAKISFELVLLVWVWSFVWMQVADLLKVFQKRLS